MRIRPDYNDRTVNGHYDGITYPQNMSQSSAAMRPVNHHLTTLPRNSSVQFILLLQRRGRTLIPTGGRAAGGCRSSGAEAACGRVGCTIYERGSRAVTVIISLAIRSDNIYMQGHVYVRAQSLQDRHVLAQLTVCRAAYL